MHRGWSMTMQIETLANLMVKIVIMVSVGYLLQRLGVIDEYLKKKLSELLLVVVLPLSVLATGNHPYSSDITGRLLGAAGISAVYYALALVLVWLLAKALPMPLGDRGVFVNMAVFANTAFIGFPLISALFGAEGVLYAVVYNLAYQVFLFTVGVKLLKSEEKMNWKEFLLDPLTIASVLSIVLFVSPFRLPAAVVGAMEDIGAMSVSISMMVIGCTIAGIKLRSIFTNIYAYIVSALRLVVFPLGMAVVLLWAGASGTLPAACVLLTALPAGTLNVILAERYDANVTFAAQTVVQSMVLMVASIPLIVGLLNAWF